MVTAGGGVSVRVKKHVASYFSVLSPWESHDNCNAESNSYHLLSTYYVLGT